MEYRQLHPGAATRGCETGRSPDERQSVAALLAGRLPSLTPDCAAVPTRHSWSGAASAGRVQRCAPDRAAGQRREKVIRRGPFTWRLPADEPAWSVGRTGRRRTLRFTSCAGRRRCCCRPPALQPLLQPCSCSCTWTNVAKRQQKLIKGTVGVRVLTKFRHHNVATCKVTCRILSFCCSVNLAH